MNERNRLAVDIGGTFTDLVLDTPEGSFARKILTTHTAPADAVMSGAGPTPPVSDAPLYVAPFPRVTEPLPERSCVLAATVVIHGLG